MGLSRLRGPQDRRYGGGVSFGHQHNYTRGDFVAVPPVFAEPMTA
jgi:hypothetical protein